MSEEQNNQEKNILTLEPTDGHKTWGQHIRSLVPWHRAAPAIYEDAEGNEWEGTVDAQEHRATIIRWMPLLLIVVTAPTTYFFITLHLHAIYGYVWALLTTAVFELSLLFWLHAWTKVAATNQQRKAGRDMTYISLLTVAAIFADTVLPFMQHTQDFLWGYIGYILVGFVLLTLLNVVRYITHEPQTAATHSYIKQHGMHPGVNPVTGAQKTGHSGQVRVTAEQWKVIQENDSTAGAARALGKDVSWVRKAKQLDGPNV